ncbi:MAG: 50S ribosomal protein L15 [Lentisphaerae bacterium]|nr:50S ribosomal protein L15 [Lentisphaerota bacterium]
MGLDKLRNNAGARHRKMRIGCGNGSGKGGTSGRGHKGQYARSGHKHKPGFEGGQMRLLRRIPKRGFNNKVHKTVFNLVQIGQLERFEADTEVTPRMLREAGLVRTHGAGSDAAVKILGNGELSRKLSVQAHAFSRAAEQKITAAGGACTVIK